MAEQRRTILVNSVILGVALLLAAAVVVWMLVGGEPSVGEPEPSEAAIDQVADDEIGFGPFEYDLARLEQEWRDERGGNELEVGEAEQDLIEAFYRNNEQAARGRSPTQLMALNDHMVVSVSQYISVHGPRAYRALSWLLVDEFHRAMDQALARAEQQGVHPREVLEADDEAARDLRERLGNFYEMAQATGLVDDSGRPRFDRSLLTVLFRYRWFGFAEDYANLSLMTPYERVVLWRWRIEAAEGIPLVQRLAMVDEIDEVYRPDIDPDAVRGILCYRSGDLQRAHSFFRRASRNHPEDERYARYLSITARHLNDTP